MINYWGSSERIIKEQKANKRKVGQLELITAGRLMENFLMEMDYHIEAALLNCKHSLKL